MEVHLSLSLSLSVCLSVCLSLERTLTILRILIWDIQFCEIP
jgi:hypothetical protein